MALGSELSRTHKRGAVRQSLGQENGLLCHLSLSLLQIAATSTSQEPAKSKVQPIPLGEERSQGTGGKEGVRRVPRGAGLPILLPRCRGEPHPPLLKVLLGLGSQVGAGQSPGHLGEPLPIPGTKIAHRRAPRCSRGTTGMPAGAGGLWMGPPWRRWGRACTSPRPGWSSPAPPATRGPHP